jgi:hypothetical protein
LLTGWLSSLNIDDGTSIKVVQFHGYSMFMVNVAKIRSLSSSGEARSRSLYDQISEYITGTDRRTVRVLTVMRTLTRGME